VETRKRLASTLTPLPSCGASEKTVAAASFCSHILIVVAVLSFFAGTRTRAQAPAKSAQTPVAKSRPKPATIKKRADTPSSSEALEKQLALLSRALHDRPNATTYSGLAAFAARSAKNETGSRAALALAYYDLSREKPDLALGWLRKAVGDKLLREYVLFWQAEASSALGQKEAGLEQFQSILRDFPESAITEQAVTAIAQNALALGKPQDALLALEAYAGTATKSPLLLLRAQAKERVAAAKGEKPVAAATDYLDLYYRFPLNDEAKTAGEKVPALQSALGESFPGVPMQTQISRAEAFYLAHRWREASTEYAALLPKLSGADHQHADLRIVQCEVELGGRLEQLGEISLTEPDLDAERTYSLEQAHRAQKLEAELLADVELLAKRYPQSSWTSDALFGAGNFYWVSLDRARAADFYRRSLDVAPDGRNAYVADWRLAWIAYMQRKPEAADMLEAYVRRYPTSSYIQDALYWLGRFYQRAGDLERARIFYLADANRFPLTYFGEKAEERLRPEPDGIGETPADPSGLTVSVPPAPPVPSLDAPAELANDERLARARALSDIAFDSSAELEYRAAYAATHSPIFLIDAAGAAIAAGHYGAGMSEVRQAIPQLEARRIPDIPIEAWRAAFPFPYELNLRSEAARNRVDPMLIAGLIRQESAFESKAMSHAGAMGLMQVMPKTALKLSREMRVRYARARLTDPGYNLELGSRYLANLIRDFGTPEAALAAYNAGEDHVTEWRTGQNYEETAEFVESIPFTETREYVQIVLRNAEVYRLVYGATPPAAAPPERARVSARGRVKSVAAHSTASAEARTAGVGETH
jgi:soluble lytic murein transglycosylase